MLQKADKDRLDKVLQLIEKVGLRFPVADISKAQGRNKGEVSTYLSGKKPMSDNFYKTFIKHFETGEKPSDLKETQNNSPVGFDAAAFYNITEAHRISDIENINQMGRTV